jgi:hypothetical protein
MSDRLDEFDQSKFLYEQYDNLVKTELRGIAIVEDIEGHSPLADLLIEEAKNGFLEAISVLISGDLDFFTEAGVAKAARAQETLKRYRNMLSWIGEAITKAQQAREEMGILTKQMKVLYEDERSE